jgi:ariadne-1
MTTGGNPDAIRKAAGVTSASYELEQSVPAKQANAQFDCPICMENVKMRDTYALGCGHRYCKSCWRTYLELKTGEADCIHTHCPWPKCTEAVHERAFHTLMGEAAQKFTIASLSVLSLMTTTSSSSALHQIAPMLFAWKEETEENR